MQVNGVEIASMILVDFTELRVDESLVLGRDQEKFAWFPVKKVAHGNIWHGHLDAMIWCRELQVIERHGILVHEEMISTGEHILLHLRPYDREALIDDARIVLRKQILKFFFVQAE